MTTKTCTNCGKVKPLEAFSDNFWARGGVNPQCKDCVSAKKRAYYALNLECIRMRARTYYLANKERIAERNRAYYLANKEKIAPYKKRWEEANKCRRAELRELQKLKNRKI